MKLPIKLFTRYKSSNYLMIQFIIFYDFYFIGCRAGNFFLVLAIYMQNFSEYVKNNVHIFNFEKD